MGMRLRMRNMNGNEKALLTFLRSFSSGSVCTSALMPKAVEKITSKANLLNQSITFTVFPTKKIKTKNIFGILSWKLPNINFNSNQGHDNKMKYLRHDSRNIWMFAKASNFIVAIQRDNLLQWQEWIKRRTSPVCIHPIQQSCYHGNALLNCRSINATKPAFTCVRGTDRPLQISMTNQETTSFPVFSPMGRRGPWRVTRLVRSISSYSLLTHVNSVYDVRTVGWKIWTGLDWSFCARLSFLVGGGGGS